MMRAGIYNRCSTEEEAQVNALMIQAAESKEIVLSMGWEPVRQYIESQSGTTAQKRTQYQRLLQDMETDQFDVVVIKSIDRLMRSVKDWYLFLDRLTRNNKQLYIYLDRKFYTPEDSLLTGIKAILAEEFSRELSKKIKNAHRRRQTKMSGLNITREMFGWDKKGRNEFVLNEEEAAYYRLAFALAAEGKGFYSIANILYEQGARSKSGRRISDVQWRKMLYSPRARGTVVLHTTEYDFEAKCKRRLPESEWISMEDALPAIVPGVYQESVLESLRSRRRAAEEGDAPQKEGTKCGYRAGLYPLSGKIYCASCGSAYYRSAGAVIKWRCSKAMREGRKHCDNRILAEAQVLAEIERLSIDRYGASFFQNADTDRALIKEFEKERAALHQKKTRLLEKWMESVIGDEDFTAANKVIEDRLKRLEDRDSMTDHGKTGNVQAFLGKIQRILAYPDGRLEVIWKEQA